MEIIPLIDVIFFLLATFVLFTLTLHRIRVFEPELPKVGGPTEVVDDTTAFIQASVDGTYHWRVGTHGAKETLTAAELGPRLMHYRQSVPAPRVLVRSDPHFEADDDDVCLLLRGGWGHARRSTRTPRRSFDGACAF